MTRALLSIFLSALCALAGGCGAIPGPGTLEHRETTTVPFLGKPRTVSYTYRVVPRRFNLTGANRPTVVVFADLPFLATGFEALMREQGFCPPGTRTNRNTYSGFRGLEVAADGSATGSFEVRNRQFQGPFLTEVSDVTVAVRVRLVPVVDADGHLAFRLETSHRKVSGSGLAPFLDELSGGTLINVQGEIDQAAREALRNVPAEIRTGFTTADLGPGSGPKRLTLAKARFLRTATSPVGMEFLFTLD